MDQMGRRILLGNGLRLMVPLRGTCVSFAALDLAASLFDLFCFLIKLSSPEAVRRCFMLLGIAAPGSLLGIVPRGADVANTLSLSTVGAFLAPLLATPNALACCFRVGLTLLTIGPDLAPFMLRISRLNWSIERL
jgi:hypothetical protein